MKNEPHVNIRSARTAEQKAIMEQIVKDGVCPFCIKHLRKYHSQPILKEGVYWILTENAFPYEDTRVHLMFIYKRHLTRLPTRAEPLQELTRFIAWAEKKYSIRGGSLLCRFGETKYNGASVDHLHLHLIVGDVDNPEHKPVRVKVG